MSIGVLSTNQVTPPVQAGGIHLGSVDQFLFARGFGHMLPKLLNDGIRAASLEKNSDSSNLAVAGLVHQVGYHIVGLTVSGFFAGMVKVELRQFVTLVSHE